MISLAIYVSAILRLDKYVMLMCLVAANKNASKEDQKEIVAQISTLIYAGTDTSELTLIAVPPDVVNLSFS
jgi:hypothetical protein